jgi:hypothetical protein
MSDERDELLSAGPLEVLEHSVKGMLVLLSWVRRVPPTLAKKDFAIVA